MGLSTKTNTLNSNLTRTDDPHETQLRLIMASSINTVCGKSKAALFIRHAVC